MFYVFSKNLVLEEIPKTNSPHNKNTQKAP